LYLALLSYSRMVEELVKYPSSFSLSASHIKLTQAYWLIDHKVGPERYWSVRIQNYLQYSRRMKFPH